MLKDSILYFYYKLACYINIKDYHRKHIQFRPQNNVKLQKQER